MTQTLTSHELYGISNTARNKQSRPVWVDYSISTVRVARRATLLLVVAIVATIIIYTTRRVFCSGAQCQQYVVAASIIAATAIIIQTKFCFPCPSFMRRMQLFIIYLTKGVDCKTLQNIARQNFASAHRSYCTHTTSRNGEILWTHVHTTLYCRPISATRRVRRNNFNHTPAFYY